MEGTGATEKLTDALMKLYQEEKKPADPVIFIRQHLGDDCPADKIIELEERVKGLQKEQNVLTTEREVAQGQIKRSPSAELRLLTKGIEKLFEEDDPDNEDRSLLQKFLTEELFETLKDLRTRFQATLYDQIQSGLANFEQEIGIFASDPHAYEVFRDLFTPVLETLHYSPNSQPSMDLGDTKDIEDLDPEELFIKSIKISIHRSLENIPFMPIISLDQIQLVEKKITETLSKTEDADFKGKYYPLIDIEEEQLKKWIEEEITFGPPENEDLKNAQTYRMWSKCRGIYLNEKKDFRVWINAEEHMNMIILEEGGNLKLAYEKFIKAIDFLGDLKFARDAHWGFLTHNLKNIGTAMEVSVEIRLPKLGLRENETKVATLCDGSGIIADRLDGRGLYKLYNLKKVGMTEIDLVKNFQKGVKDFIIAEKCCYLSKDSH